MRDHSYRRALTLAGLIIIAAQYDFARAATLYFQTNLTSDIPGLAANTDPNLKNPWGMSFTAISPFWVSDQVTNVSTLYNGAGVPKRWSSRRRQVPQAKWPTRRRIFN